jgi:hypothetical protein
MSDLLPKALFSDMLPQSPYYVVEVLYCSIIHQGGVVLCFQIHTTKEAEREDCVYYTSKRVHMCLSLRVAFPEIRRL